ncbi:hypothetical protein [Microvirga sp. BSC39]|uniref:hypothetical protein n=1 Tax=Microvirga sp. BSC39 TaxID=1549810 RepID=UPI0004E91AF5|nr:hypothetical protein [Microvirga sp. BSC39]KFG69307.1 hypothetical protein JH26_10720 [Microvirga sp. BSC39]
MAMVVAMETGMAAGTAVTKAMEVVTATVPAVATQEAGIAVARLAGAPGTLMEADAAAGLELLAMAAEMAMLVEAPGAAMLAVRPEVPQEAVAEMGMAGAGGTRMIAA